MKTKFFLSICLLALSSQFTSVASQTLNVSIRNIKNPTKGIIRIAIFTDEKGFRAEKDFIAFEFEKKNIKNGTMNVEIPIKKGLYGLSVLDDENNNCKMDYSVIGIPKEGFGFSNFKLTKMRKPKFEDFSFTVGSKEVKDIVVSMRYM